MDKIKYTKTSTFLFPLLNIPRSTFNCNILYSNGNVRFNTRFINAYLKDNSVLQYEEQHLFLIIRNFRDKEFDKFYTTITSYENYKDSYEKNDYLILIFKIPEENMEDYNLILNGKYSKVSEIGKSLIIKNFFFGGKPVVVQLILNKATVMKDHWDQEVGYPGIGDQEVYSKISPELDSITTETLKGLSSSSKILMSREFE